MSRPAPVGVDPTLCPGLTLWERALPAKTPSQAPHLPNCASPIRTPSRAEPAPTITGSCMDSCQVQPMSRPALVEVDPTPCPGLTLWERALPAKTPSQAPHLSNCAPPIRTPSRAEPAPSITRSCMDSCQVQPMSRPAPVGVDPTLCPSLTLWERALPAKTPSQAPHLPNCASPIQTPSRAEPAPAITGSCMDLCQVQQRSH